MQPLKAVLLLLRRARYPRAFAYFLHSRDSMAGNMVPYYALRHLGCQGSLTSSTSSELRSDSLKQPDTPHKILESWLLAQAVKSLIHFEPRHHWRVLLVSLLQPCKRFVFFAQADI